jgi:hypothetical protein
MHDLERMYKNSRGLIEVIFPHFHGKITKELEESLVADFEFVTFRIRSRGAAHWISTSYMAFSAHNVISKEDICFSNF